MFIRCLFQVEKFLGIFESFRSPITELLNVFGTVPLKDNIRD